MSSIEAMARNFQMQRLWSPITPTDIAAAAGGPQPEINEHTNEFDRLFTDGYFNDLTHDPVVQHDRRRQQPLPEP